MSAPKGKRERLRQVIWAGMIALALQVLTVLVPADKVLRIWQYSLLSNQQASGEIVFVGADSDLSDPAFPARREKLASLIEDLDRAGVKEIYVDFVFDQPSDPAADAHLNGSLLSTRGRAVLVERYTTGLVGTNELEASDPAIAAGVDRAGSQLWTDFFGYVWYMPYTLPDKAEPVQTIATRIAGSDFEESSRFPVSYFFDVSTIPTLRFETLEQERESLDKLAGKTAIIAAVASEDQTSVNLPGLPDVSPALVHIFAAETLKAQQTSELDGMSVLLAILIAMLACSLLAKRKPRYFAYGIICLSLPIAFFIAGQMTVRMSAAGAIVLLIAYAAFRARALWKQSFRLVDDATNLPTFAALEADKVVSETIPAIIVAKIHRFEEVRRTLPQELHAEYVLRIIARLKAATQDATIYLGQGHLIAWTMAEKEPALLKEHLEGLRALFASPLNVGENQVDVGITFGVDISPSPQVAKRIAAAVSAAEDTNETFEPIGIAESASDEDLIWNISLQARIDAALANGEIYLVYQPKVSVVTGEVVGVEALVRWNDPVKGHIPPDHFIRQCENAGRMGHLTRHVLIEGCKAGVGFQQQGDAIPVAVNISATMIHERSIVRMVREVLAQTGFDPRMLVLEITETYRISNLDHAAEILSELKALGAKISMDDFGVGAASMEALLRLPFSELKIDRIFVAEMTREEKARGIVQNVLNLGADLGITVVAEGVEDEQTLKILADSGCKVAQGFGLSRPIPFKEALEFQKLTRLTDTKDSLPFTNKGG